MTIEFRKDILYPKFLDPAKSFAETVSELEVRTDPLTRKNSYLSRATRRVFEKRDLSLLKQKSLDSGCPFCPQAVDAVTPKFIPELVPEGRIQVGEARIFPNARPYTMYSAIVVLSGQHFVELTDFAQEMVTNGLMAGQIYLKGVQGYDAEAKYLYLGWNHLPPAGASLVHPHLHAEATYLPTSYQGELMEASHRYYTANGTNFWSDLINEEGRLGERYIGDTGSVCWLTCFAPKGRFLDILAIFRQRNSLLDISAQEFGDFVVGLRRVLRYMSEQHFYSFNLTLTSGVAGEDYLWTQARIIPRITFGLDTSDCCYHELLQEFYLVSGSPEDNCQSLKPYFNERG